MESRRWSLVITVVAASYALTACAAEPGLAPGDAVAGTSSTTTTPDSADRPVFALPDVTARPITAADVIAMLPTGAAGMAESAEPSVEPMTTAELLTRATLDPNDEASDVVRFGRLVGASGEYPQGDSSTAYVWIDVLVDAEAAHGYLLDYAGDAIKGAGGTHAPDATALSADEYPADIGEEAIGLDLDVTEGTRETAVIFRIGRIVVWVSVARTDQGDARVAVQYLAEEVADRIVSTLTTGAPTAPRPDTPDHRFDTSISIDAGGDRYAVEVTGNVSGGNSACSLHLITEDGERSEDLLMIDGILWSGRPGAGDPALVGGNLAQRSLVALCPPWPLDARDAGLTTLSASATPHEVNGVVAWGYRSDLTGLQQVLGASLDGVTIETFSYWVADGVPWLLELNITARGDAAELEPLTGPGFASLGDITVSIRHRILDLGVALDPILAPG